MRILNGKEVEYDLFRRLLAARKTQNYPISNDSISVIAREVKAAMDKLVEMGVIV